MVLGDGLALSRAGWEATSSSVKWVQWWCLPWGDRRRHRVIPVACWSLGEAQRTRPVLWPWRAQHGPALCPGLVHWETREEAMAGALLASALYLCEPAVNLSHKEGGSAKDPKTLGPTTLGPFVSSLAEATHLEVGRFAL